MNEDQTPLHQIAWQRVSGELSRRWSKPAANGEVRNLFARNWRALAQTALIIFTVVVVDRIHPIPIATLWSAVKSRLPGSGDDKWWYAAAGAALLVARWNWIESIAVRLGYIAAKSIFRILLGLLGVWMVGASGRADSYPSLMCLVGYFLIARTVFGWIRKPTMFSKGVDDDLHRRYFSNRIAEVFLDSEKFERLNRVAILGEWGAGKSRVLDLIAERLTTEKSPKFVIARVNPWKASTAGDAWAVVAAEIDRALGYSPLAPMLRQSYPWLAAFVDVFPSLGISKDFVKLLGVDGGQSETKLISRINRRLEGIRERVVVLVDDMERTDPAILRQLFPVIDQIAGIRHAAFVFAIDPTKVAEAFGESSRAGGNTKGYLDKVFDLQIELPEPEAADVYRMILAKAELFKADKLVAALPSLEKYMPTSPRIALRFLDFAVSNEHLFLSRYGPREKCYAAVFLAWLADIEFPGFMDKLIENERHFTPCLAPDFMQMSELTQDSQFMELIRVATTSFGESNQKRLSKLLEGVISLSRNGGIEFGTAAVNLKWAKSGFKILMEMSSQELAALHEKWIESNSAVPIENLISEASAGSHRIGGKGLDFVNLEECAKQLVDREVTVLLELAVGSGGAVEGGLGRDMRLGRCSALRKHLRAAVEQRWELERRVFNGPLLRRICHHAAFDDSDPGADSPSFSVWRFGIRRFAVELVKVVELSDLSWISVEMRMLFRGDLGSDGKPPLKFSKSREAIRLGIVKRMREFVIHCLRDGDLVPLLERGGIAETEGWGFFWVAENWLRDSDEIKATMTMLMREARENQRLAAQCARVVSVLFFGRVKRGENGMLQKLNQRHPGYVTGFWGAAMQLSEGHELREMLLRERGSARSAQPVPLSGEGWFDELFPVEVGTT